MWSSRSTRVSELIWVYSSSNDCMPLTQFVSSSGLTVRRCELKCSHILTHFVTNCCSIKTKVRLDPLKGWQKSCQSHFHKLHSWSKIVQTWKWPAIWMPGQGDDVLCEAERCLHIKFFFHSDMPWVSMLQWWLWHSPSWRGVKYLTLRATQRRMIYGDNKRSAESSSSTLVFLIIGSSSWCLNYVSIHSGFSSLRSVFSETPTEVSSNP